MIFLSKKYILLLSILLLSTAGVALFVSWENTHVKNIDQFNNWLNEQGHGCVLSRKLGGVCVTVKYQPPLYLVVKDLGSDVVPEKIRGRVIDSLVQQQAKMFHVLMTIGPDKDQPEQRQAAPVMTGGVQGYGDFVERVMSTNFFMDQHLSLYVDGVRYKPALCIVDNVYELAEQRSFNIVFVADGKTNINDGKEFIFEYDDSFFDIGKIQFNFPEDKLAKARDIKVALN